MTLALPALNEDYLYPEAPGPMAQALSCARAGFHLIRRPAFYPDSIHDEWGVISPAIALLTARL